MGRCKCACLKTRLRCDHEKRRHARTRKYIFDVQLDRNFHLKIKLADPEMFLESIILTEGTMVFLLQLHFSTVQCMHRGATELLAPAMFTEKPDNMASSASD